MSALISLQASAGECVLTHKHVLLVDDNPLLASRIRSTLKFLVKSHEFVVTTVATGADAVRAIIAFDFDLIICDMMMPHMAGDMFYLAVQRIKPQMIPRLLFVSDPGQPELNAYLQSINAQVVYKPVEAKALECAITAVLGRKKRAPGSLDIDLDCWRDVPCLTDRIADEEDVRAGRAVFCIRPLNDICVSFADIGLPHCAIFTNEHRQQFPVVVIQSERAGNIHYVGFRFLARGNGIGFRFELDLIDEPNELFQSSPEWGFTEQKSAEDIEENVQIMPAQREEASTNSRTDLQLEVDATRAKVKQVFQWADRDRYEMRAWS